MADETIDIVLTGRVDSKIAQSIRDIGIAAEKTDSSLDELRESLRGFAGLGSGLSTYSLDVKELRTEVQKAVRDQKAFADATRATGQELKTAAAGANKFARELKDVDRLNNQTGKSFTNLNGIVGNFAATFASIFAIQKYAEAQDTLTNIQNKIKSLTTDTERQVAIQQRLFEVANLTRSGIDATADGFVRFSKAMKDASDTEVLRFVETLNKSLITAGRTTAEVNSIVVQLGQALTSGRLMGDEFRALSESLPREALQAFADQLGVGVEQLKELSSQGLITTDVIRAAFGELADTIDEQFARSIPTISQSLTVLDNKFIEFTKNTSGGAALIAKGILFIGDNLNIVIPIVAAFGAAWLTVQAVKVLSEIVGGLLTVVKAIQAGISAVLLFVSPWALLAAIIIAAAVAMAYFTGNLDGVIEGIKKYTGEIFGAINEQTGLKDIMAETSATAETLKSTFSTMTSSVTDNTKATIANTKAVEDWKTRTTNNVNEVASSYDKLSASIRAAAAAAGAAQFRANDPGAGNRSTSGSFTTLGKGSATGGNSIRKFAGGGSFRVSGRGGVDKNLVQFRASNGEHVNIQTPQQQREDERRRKGQGGNGGPPTFNFFIQTPDADSFRLSRNQIANSTFSAVA